MSAAARSASQAAIQAATKAAAKAAAVKAAAISLAQAAKAAAKEAAKAALKSSKDFIKTVGQTSGAKFAKNAAKKVLQKADDAASSMKNFIKNNPNKVIGGLAVGTAGAIAYDNYARLNDKVFSIKAIIPKKKGDIAGLGGKNVLYIEYIDPEKDKNKLRVHDIIVITDSDSKESADGTYVILSANNSVPSITVGKDDEDKTPMPNITKNGENGKITYKTTFENQIGGLIGDAAGETADILGDTVKNVTDETLKNLGIPEDWLDYVYAFFAFIMFVLLMGALYKGYEMLRSKTTNTVIMQAAPVAAI